MLASTIARIGSPTGGGPEEAGGAGWLKRVDDPGGGPTFRSVLMAPMDTMREVVRRLLPYTAILLGELERPSELRNETITERVVSSLACFVVVIDAHLRVKCGLPAEVDAVVAEATAARVAEFCGLVSC